MRRPFLLLAGAILTAAAPAAAQDTRGELCWWTTDVARCRNIIVAELGFVVPLAGGVRSYVREDTQLGTSLPRELRPPAWLSGEVGLLHALSGSVAAGATLQLMDGAVQMSARARHEMAERAFLDVKVGITRAQDAPFEEGLGGDGDRVGITLEARLGRHRFGSVGLRYDDLSWPELPASEHPRYYWLDGESGGRQRSLATVVALEPPGTVVGSVAIVLFLGVVAALFSGWAA